MTHIRQIALAAASGLILAACAPAPEPAPAAPTETTGEEDIAVTPESAPEESAATDAATGECAVLESRDWEAWVNRMPGPDATPSVHVVGKVDVRSGGYTFDWEVGPMDRSMTPALRLELIPVAPTGMATMAITTEEVHYTGPLAGSAYSRVTITCGGQTLGEITEIPDAQ